MDVKMAYLHGVLKEEIYMEQLEGFVAQGDNDKVCKLVLSLYGLKQAGRVWNRTFANTIRKNLCFKTIHSDVGVYILCQRQGRNTKIILILYVDDLPLLGEDQSKIEDVKHQLGNLYHMKDLGPASSYLGIRITRDHKSRSIWIDQEAYIDNALKRFKLQDANNTKTLLPASLHLEKYEGTATTKTKTQFQQMIRTLIYTAIGTRPDIAFAATQLSQFNNNPSNLHIKKAKHMLRYLKGKKDLCIKYDGSSIARLIGYSDLDWGENRDDCHSTSGHMFLMANGCISWASQCQKTVALSVGEVEYMELASTGRQATWLKSISRETGFSIHEPIPLCTDNQAVIFLTVNPAVECRTKHIDI